MTHFVTNPLARFGVEVDYDLSRPLDPEGAAALRELLYREKLLVFHDQLLSEAQQRGVLEHFCRTLPPDEDHRDLSLEGYVGRCALAYHGDVMFVDDPYRVLSLYALDIDEDSGTATRFANAALAAARLPAELRDTVATMTTTVVFPPHVSRREMSYDMPSFLPRYTRPVLWPHPVTGEEVLFIFELYTSRIEGLAEPESDALLEKLFAHLYAEDAIQEHVWQTGDIVIWDNMSLQHGRTEQLTAKRRELRRIVAAEKSMFAQCPQFDPTNPEFLEWTKGRRRSRYRRTRDSPAG